VLGAAAAAAAAARRLRAARAAIIVLRKVVSGRVFGECLASVWGAFGERLGSVWGSLASVWGVDSEFRAKAFAASSGALVGGLFVLSNVQSDSPNVCSLMCYKMLNLFLLL
jgi:hypothetical protein